MLSPRRHKDKAERYYKGHQVDAVTARIHIPL